MNTCEALRDELFDVFRKLKKEKIMPKIAKEMNNSAGKIIQSARAQLEYHVINKTKAKIAFFESGAKA